MTQVEPALVVMAAGIGSRFGGTKQLAEVGPRGEALLDYTIDQARRAGFGPVVLIVRSAIRDDVAAHLARFHDDADDFTLVCQDLEPTAAAAGPRERPWGTGHAVLAVRDHVDRPFAVVNADDYYGTALDELARAFAEPGGASPTTYHLVAYRLANTLSDEGTVSRGVCRVAADGTLEAVTEHLALSRGADGRIGGPDAAALADDTPVSMNLWGLHPSLFGHLAARFDAFARANADRPTAELQLPTVITELIGEGLAHVRVHHTDAVWLGVTYPGDLEHARLRLSEVHGPAGGTRR